MSYYVSLCVCVLVLDERFLRFSTRWLYIQFRSARSAPCNCAWIINDGLRQLTRGVRAFIRLERILYGRRQQFGSPHSLRRWSIFHDCPLGFSRVPADFALPLARNARRACRLHNLISGRRSPPGARDVTPTWCQSKPIPNLSLFIGKTSFLLVSSNFED